MMMGQPASEYRNMVVEGCRGIVLNQVNQFRWFGDVEELRSVANEGLVLGSHFVRPEYTMSQIATFLTKYVRGKILDYIQSKVDRCEVESQLEFEPAEKDLGYEHIEILDLIEKVLSPIQQRVIVMKYYDDMTFKEMGEELNLTKQRVQQIHSKCLEILFRSI